MTAIRARGLRKSFGDVTAVDGLALTVEAGEVFGFLGPNGAGKSTTINVLTGQVRPDAGEVSVLGTDPATEGVETRRRVGILPERQSPPSYLTPREYFSFVGAVHEVDEATLTDRVEAWVDRLSFREKLDTVAADLSRGQQQKAMVTAAFLHEPSVVFIDEPLANLDPIVQERLKRYVTAYAGDGNAVFLSTHHVEVAEEICTRVGVLRDGSLVGRERPADLDAEESLLDAFLASVDEAPIPEDGASGRTAADGDRARGRTGPQPNGGQRTGSERDGEADRAGSGR